MADERTFSQPPLPGISSMRAEAMGATSAGVTAVGQRIGGAVAGNAAARSSVMEQLTDTAQAIRDLQKEVDNFVQRSGKRFTDTLERAARMLKDAQSAASGLGDSLGGVGSGYERYAASREQTAKSLENARNPNTARAPAATQLSFPGMGGGSGPSNPNNGGVARHGVPGQQGAITIEAAKVIVNGGGGGGGGGGTPTAEGERENGGAARFAGMAAMAAAGGMFQMAGRRFQEQRQDFFQRQIAMSRLGISSIGAQQDYMRAFTNAGGWSIGRADETAALEIGGRNLGGTNFNAASLAGLQQMAPGLSMEAAAGLASSTRQPGLRNRLLFYGGQSTRGMSYEQTLDQLVRTAVGKQHSGAALTEEDYNSLNTLGSVSRANLQMLTGGDQTAIEGALASAAKQAGLPSTANRLNEAAQSEIGLMQARTKSANEQLDELAATVRASNKALSFFNDMITKSATLQALSTGAGAISTLGGATAALGLGQMLMGGRALRMLGNRGGPSGGPLNRGPGSGPAPRPGVGGMLKGGLWGLAAGAADWGWSRFVNPNLPSWARASDQTQQQFDSWVPWGEGSSFREAIMGGLNEDVGDPPDGSAIRTSKPESHVTGLNPQMRNALEQMFRDNPRLRLNSGYRSIEHQERLWAEALRKYGDPEIADNWVARPGSSKHNFGLAADVGPPSQYGWLKANAHKYGLHLPLNNEPWHLEVRGSRSGKELVDINIKSGGSRSTDKKRSAHGGNGGGKKGMGSFFSLGGASEGAVLQGALGGGGLFGGSSPSEAPTRSGGDPSGTVTNSADKAMINSAGAGAFTGSLVDRAAAVARVAKNAGFRGEALLTAVAVALGESRGDPMAKGDVSLQTDKWGPSLGLWQNRTLKNFERWSGIDGMRDASKMYDPQYNANFAYALYRDRGGSFQDWSVYTEGIYKNFLDEAQAGIAQIGDPPSGSGGGVDGSSGGSVMMRGGDKTVVMHVYGQQNPAELAQQVAQMLRDQEDMTMVGST